MGLCDSSKSEKDNRNKEYISNEIQQPFSRKEIKEFENNKLKKGICLYIKKDINSIISYYFYINNIFIITTKNNLKEDNNNIILYDNKSQVYLHKLGEKIMNEKYGYFFFETKEFQDYSTDLLRLDINILNDQKDEIYMGENVSILNQDSCNSIKIKSINIDNTFEYEYTNKRVINNYGDLIENSKKNIIGINIGDKYGILIKPILKEFFELRNKNFLNDNNSNKDMLNNEDNNNKTKYIIPLLLSFAKIEKFKNISKNSFKSIKIDEDNVIYLIRKFLIYYRKKDDSNTKNVINQFEKLYNEENINFKYLFDFISDKSLQKFQIDKSINAKSFLQNQNDIQKILFIIFKNQGICPKCNYVNKQYICNNMYLYSENKQCQYLHTLIYDWENETNENCPSCQYKPSIKGEIIYWPEILIIIMNDNNQIKNIDELRIQKYEIEYKLICYIGYSENNNFNVFYKELNKWYMIKNDDYFTSEDIQNKIKSLVKYPCVLFYEKIKSNNNSNNSIDLRNNETQNKIMLNNYINNNQKYKNIYLGTGDENKNAKIKTNSLDINYINPNSINNRNVNNPTFYYPSIKSNIINPNKLVNSNKLTFTPISNISLNNNPHRIQYLPNQGYLNTTTIINNNINYNNPNHNPNTYGHLNTPIQNAFLTQNNINNNLFPTKLENKNNHISRTPNKTNNKHNIRYSINSGISNNTIYNIHSNKNNNNNSNVITHDYWNKPLLTAPFNGNNKIKTKEIYSGNLDNRVSSIPLNTISPINKAFQSNQNLYNNSKDTKVINEAYTEQINYNYLPLNQNTFDKNSEKSNIKSNGSKISNKINNNNNITNNKNENEKEITLFFIFNNGKELYLDVKRSLPFSEVIKKLKEKYLWLKDNINIKEFQFKGKKISKKQIVKDIGLDNESEINIIESN